MSDDSSSTKTSVPQFVGDINKLGGEITGLATSLMVAATLIPDAPQTPGARTAVRRVLGILSGYMNPEHPHYREVQELVARVGT